MSRSRKRRAIDPIDEIEPIESIDDQDILNTSTIPSSLPSSPHSDSEMVTPSHTSIIQQLTLETETGQIEHYIRDENESNDQPLSLSQPIATTTKKSKVKRSKRSPISTTNSRDIRAMLQSQSRTIEQNKKKQSVSLSSNGSPHSTSWQHVDIPSLMQYVGIAPTTDDAAIAAELQSYEAASTKRVLRSQAKLMNTRPIKYIVDSSNKADIRSAKSPETISNRSVKSPEIQLNKTMKPSENQTSRSIKSPEIQPTRSVRSPEICLSQDESPELNEDSDHEHPLDVTVVVDSVSNELHPIERASTVVNGNPVAINLSPPQSDHSTCLQSHSWLDNASVSHIRKGVNECVVATAPGFYRAYNQDSGMIVDTNDSLVFSVCDGHGALGETASRTACDMLTTKVALAMCQSKDSEVVAKRVMQSFDETQNRLLDIAKIEHTAFIQATTKHRAQQNQSLQTLSSNYEPKSPQLSHQPLVPVSRSPVKKSKLNQNTASPVEIQMDCDYGTTAVVVACCREWTVIANCGDSRACVWRETSGTKLVHPRLELMFKTEDHNPSENASEVERVRQDGGAILILPNQYRIYPASMPLEEARSRALTLNMSRALGHRKLNECGISAKPDITQISNKSTNDQSLVICAGSDGLWDQLSVDDVRIIIERHLPCLKCTVSALLREADTRWLARGGGDNITVGVYSSNPER